MGERCQGTIARFDVSLGVDRLDADLIDARVEMRPEAAPDRFCVTPKPPLHR